MILVSERQRKPVQLARCDQCKLSSNINKASDVTILPSGVLIYHRPGLQHHSKPDEPFLRHRHHRLALQNLQ